MARRSLRKALDRVFSSFTGLFLISIDSKELLLEVQALDGRHLIKLILFKSGAINSSFGRFMADYHLHPSFVLLICNQLIEQCFISFQGPSFVCPVSLSLIAHFLFSTWSEEMWGFTVGHNYKLWKTGFSGSFESFRSMQPFPVTVPPKTMALMQHTATWQARKLSLSPTTFYYFRPYSYYKPSKSVFIE